MADVKIYKNSSDKSFELLIEELVKGIEAEGYGVYHQDKSDIAAFYRGEGVELSENYKHTMLQICKPQASGKTLLTNPERSIFLHKYIFIYNQDDKTEIRFLGYSADIIGDLLGHNEFEEGPTDDFFAKNMENIYSTMEKIVGGVV